uniref:Uncharacterized protein n=1 Tax=Porphyridium purpureum TaxID=35688 RepID=W0S238_PORPP|nr:hypothetical protein Y721_p025 [Porphyridium purpureum]BAO23783.1 hypothetical protein [Porphyridium purpureum]
MYFVFARTQLLKLDIFLDNLAYVSHRNLPGTTKEFLTYPFSCCDFPASTYTNIAIRLQSTVVAGTIGITLVPEWVRLSLTKTLS